MSTTSPERRLHELGIVLPEPLPVVGNYRLAKRHHDTVYLAGHVSLKLDRTGLITGKVGDDISTEQAQEAARIWLAHDLHATRGDRVA